MPLFPAALAAALAFGLFTVTPAAEAQPAGKVVRIGLLDYAASDPASAARWTALRERLRELRTWKGRTSSMSPGGEMDKGLAFEAWPPS